jgi:hypothetical protein
MSIISNSCTMLFLKSSNMVGLLLVKIRSSTYKHINIVLPSSSFFTYIACSYGFFLYIHCMFIWTFFKSIFLKILVNSGISSMHNHRGLSSTCILCFHYLFQHIQVVIQHRSLLLGSHSEMLTSHQIDLLPMLCN